MTLKFNIGVAAFLLSIVVMILNIVIFVPVFRLGFIEKKSTVYIIAFFNIISDLLQLLTSGLYLSASIIHDRYIFTEERINTLSIVIGGVFINGWYMESLVQIVMAVNRFTVITLNKKHIFTFKSTLVIFYFLTSFTAFSAVCTQYLFPCCMYLIQFVLISLFYILAWVLFEILPFLVPSDHREWFSVVPVLVTLNCSPNAIIYLSLNKDVQRSVQVTWLGKVFGGGKPSSQVHVAHVLAVHIN